jgi:hypothetical protein
LEIRETEYLLKLKLVPLREIKGYSELYQLDGPVGEVHWLQVKDHIHEPFNNINRLMGTITW